MTEDAAPTLSDLARLRQIAEEGRRMPLLGGRHMILWGCAVIIALLLHGAVAARLIPIPPLSIAAIWFGMMFLASSLGRTSRILRTEHKKASDIGNRIERTVWQYGGTALGVIAISIFATAMSRYHLTGSPSSFFLFAMMPPISFAVYAIALSATAEAAQLPSLKPYALGAFLFVPATVALAGSVWQFPVAALGLFIVSVLPGRMLLALEKAHGNG